jgi:hypothetical protein
VEPPGNTQAYRPDALYSEKSVPRWYRQKVDKQSMTRCLSLWQKACAAQHKPHKKALVFPATSEKPKQKNYLTRRRRKNSHCLLPNQFCNCTKLYDMLQSQPWHLGDEGLL